MAAQGTESLIRETLYGGASNEELTQEQKTTISSLSTLAAGLSGSLVGKDALNAVAAAQVGKNTVENNHLSDLERADLTTKRRAYTANCLGVTSDECAGMATDIKALLKKGGSTLMVDRFEATDFVPTMESKVSPGQVVICAISGNGYCVAQNDVIKTSQGNEWSLKPASDTQAKAAQAYKTSSEQQQADILKEHSDEMYTAGCGGMGRSALAARLGWPSAAQAR